MEVTIVPGGFRQCLFEHNMPPRKRSSGLTINAIGVLVTIAVSVLTFFGGMAIQAYTIASNVATKPYVDEGLSSARKYADERSNTVLKEAIAHSDMNRQLMTNQMLSISGDVKAQDAKLNMIKEILENIQTNGLPPRRR